MVPNARLSKIFGGAELDLATDAGYWTHVSKYRFTPSLLSADGAERSPGRFHRVGEISALYFARSPIVALLEVGMLLGDHTEFIARRSEPHVLVFVDVEIPVAVLDMTEQYNQELFETAPQELTGQWLLEDHPATQRLGRAAYDCGRVAAIKYPSARLRGAKIEPNLVVFRDRLAALRGAVMRPYDPDETLPATVARIERRSPRGRRR